MSIVAVESRHDAFFRSAAFGGAPNPTPFDTRISGPWALHLAMPFVVPGSCALTPVVPTFPDLNIVSGPAGPVTGTDQQITFSAAGVTEAQSGTLFIAWVNQANVPLYTPVTVCDGNFVTTIPKGLAGVAFAALTAQNTAQDIGALTDATVAGPAVVQIS